jgi:hypothetical protein
VVNPGRAIGYPSCPNAAFCAGLAGGDVLTSSHPSGGRRAWKITNIDGAARLFNLACASASFCLAMDSLGRVVYSTDPAGGAARWHFSAGVPGDANLTAVNCLSASLCLARDRSNNHVIASSTDPTNGSAGWRETVVNGKAIQGLSCVRPSFCAVATAYGFVASTASPASLPPHWTSANIDGFTAVTDVGCASPGLCLAADEAGRTLTSVNPTGGARAWRAAHIDGTNLISNINCPTAAFCAVVSSDGNLLTSTDPAGSVASDWHKISVPSGLSDLSCQTKSFCAGVDGAGLLTSADPAGSPSSWQQASVPVAMTHLTCPGSGLCVAVKVGTLDHDLVTTVDPAASAPVFKTTVFSSYTIDKVYCPAVSLCVAVGTDSAGRIFFFNSTHPDAGITAWHVSGAPAIGQLACPSKTECIVLKYNPLPNEPGAMFTTTDPAAARPIWHESTAPLNLASLSCPTAKLCVGAYAVDNFSPSVSGGIKTAVPAKAR